MLKKGASVKDLKDGGDASKQPDSALTGAVRSDKSAILAIGEDSLDAVTQSLADPVFAAIGNNHMHDLGEAGLAATRSALERRGIGHAEHFGEQ